MAHAMMRRERSGGAGFTIQPTALVHEAWLRMGGQDEWKSRGHFASAAARAMRRILVERARRRYALKRGSGMQRVELDEVIEVDDAGVDVLALDAALDRLAQRDERKAEIVRLRFFAGLTIEETAAVLEASVTTVKDEWMYARLWLYRDIHEQERRSEGEP